MNRFYIFAIFFIFVTALISSGDSFAQNDKKTASPAPQKQEKSSQQTQSRFNSNEPIEITSDQLQVDQLQNIAIFTGNVVAIQGDVRLKSDIMTVYYISQNKNNQNSNNQNSNNHKTDNQSNNNQSNNNQNSNNQSSNNQENNKPEKTATASTTQSIKKIDVEGNVFLTTPEETASGARGNYDVVNNEIHLYDNVVLTREQNVLKGSRLDYNFQSGRSVISGGAVATGGASQGKERVRALFVPKNSKTDNAAPQNSAPQNPASQTGAVKQ